MGLFIQRGNVTTQCALRLLSGVGGGGAVEVDSLLLATAIGLYAYMLWG